MIAIVCVDLNNGMLFNHRRQSMDRHIRKDILRMVCNKKLWMNGYSYSQFDESRENFFVTEDFLLNAGKGEFCFVENQAIPEEKLEKLIIYRWDKKYPADCFLNINLNEWKLKSTIEFEGYSHEKIMKEEYEK